MTAQPDAAALDTALSKLAIHDLSMAYCRGVDRADVDLLKSVFHEDATVLTGAFNGSGPAFCEHITTTCPGNMDYCFHSVANQWIEVKGDHAVGEHYAIAHVTAGGNDLMVGGRYVDSYERRDGVWKIKSRTFVYDWTTTHPTTNMQGDFYAALKNRGEWGKGDPVYALWESL